MISWSKMRKKLEEDYLCPALRGRIQYFATAYSKCPDQEGRAAIRLDGEEIVKSNFFAFESTAIQKMYEVVRDFPDLSQKEKMILEDRMAIDEGTFDQRAFYRAFYEFDNQSIEESLNSGNALVRIFAILDRRVGKRRLLTLAEKMEQEPDWVKPFYALRMDAEGLLPKTKEEEKA